MALQDIISPYFWGDGGEALTPGQVAERRRVADALSKREIPGLGHWAASLNQGLTGFLSGQARGRADEAEQAGIEGYKSQFDSIFGGGQPTQVASANPVASALMGGGAPQTAAGAANTLASVPSGDQAGYIRSGLINRGMPEHIADAFLLNFQDESGLNPGINEAAPTVPGSRGGYGLYQLTGPRRRAYEAYASELGVDPSNVDAQLDFLMSELQGPEARAAESIFAAPDTGTAAAAIVNQFLRPAEEHRSRREASYLGGASMPPSNLVAQAGGQPMAAQTGGMGGQPSVAQLLALAGNEWANPGQSSVVNALLGQQMQQQDPRYQQQLAQGELEMQMKQLQLQQLQNPGAPAPIEVGGVLLDPVTFQPIFDSRSENGGFTLSPGQQRFDAQGNAIAAAQPEPGFRQLTAEEVAATPNLDPSKAWQVGPDNRVYEIGGGGVNVSVGGEGLPGLGKLSTDYGYVLDPATGQPVIDPNTGLPTAAAVPGSPAALAAQQAEAASNSQAGAQITSDIEKAGTTLASTQSILDLLDNSSGQPTTGTLSIPFGIYSGSPAGQIRSYVSTLQSGVALGAMQRLKEASATGATGFGALSAPELNLLISDIGALNPDTTEPKIFRQTVDRIQERSKRVVADIRRNVSPERIAELGLTDFLNAIDPPADNSQTQPNATSTGVTWSIFD